MGGESEERLVSIERGRECFAGLSIFLVYAFHTLSLPTYYVVPYIHICLYYKLYTLQYRVSNKSNLI